MKFINLIIGLSLLLSLSVQAAYNPKTATTDNLFSIQVNNFERIQSPNSNFFSDIAYGETASSQTWCAVADEGSGSTSASMGGYSLGTDWQAGTTPAGTRLLGIALNPTLERFVAVGVNGSNAIVLTSNSPMSCAVWASQTLPSPSTYSLRDVASNGTTTVAVGELTVGNACKAIYSTNLTSWTEAIIGGAPCAGGLGGFSGVLWDGSKFVAVGTGKYATSTDGITWASGAMPTSTLYNSISYNGKVYVAVDGAGGHAAVSTNGSTWTNYSVTGDLGSVTWAGNFFIAGALNLPGYNAMYSIDGITWKSLRMFQYPSAIGYDGYMIIAIGSSVPNNMQIQRSLRIKF